MRFVDRVAGDGDGDSATTASNEKRVLAFLNAGRQPAPAWQPAAEDALPNVQANEMIEPEFGSQDYELKVALQRELVRAYVHFTRRNEFRSQSFRGLGDNRAANALALIEDEGLISALGRLRRLTKVAKVLNMLDANAGAGLAALDERIAEVRNMREHYDEYLTGAANARRQQNFVRTHTFADGVAMRSNPMWSVQRGPEEVIGCRLPVDELAQALNAYRLEIESAGWLLPLTATQLAGLATSGEKAGNR